MKHQLLLVVLLVLASCQAKPVPAPSGEKEFCEEHPEHVICP